jgi:hypothetical protein
MENNKVLIRAEEEEEKECSMLHYKKKYICPAFTLNRMPGPKWHMQNV